MSDTRKHDEKEKDYSSDNSRASSAKTTRTNTPRPSSSPYQRSSQSYTFQQDQSSSKKSSKQKKWEAKRKRINRNCANDWRRAQRRTGGILEQRVPIQKVLGETQKILVVKDQGRNILILTTGVVEAVYVRVKLTIKRQ